MTTALSGKPTFGAGRAFMSAIAANPTPTRALVPQSQSIDFKRKTEALYGEKMFAAAIGAGEMEVTGKVEFGKINARVFADLLFGDGSATGSYLEADKEAATVPAVAPETVTVANAMNFQFDLGVVNATTGALYACVAAGSEVAGSSYSVQITGANKGKYTFAAGDANVNVAISYVYANTATGESIVLSNQSQGATGGFQAVHVLPWGLEQDMFVFYNCIAGSSGVSLKKSGFANFTLDYMAAVNANDQLGVATFAEAA